MPEYWGSEGWRKPSGTQSLLSDRYRRLLSGQLKPWELPEFKGMEHTLSRAGFLGRESAGRQMRSMGIRGPAVATNIRKMGEQTMAPLGRAMGEMYGRLPMQAAGWQQHLDALAEAAKGRGLAARGQDIAKRGQDIQQMLSLLSILL